MARIIEFHIPDGFTPKTKWVPEQERGRVLVFPVTCESGRISNSAISKPGAVPHATVGQ